MLKCLKPFLNDYGAHPCGRCICCRVAYSNQWFNRLMLESSEYNSLDILFCTFTYSNEHLPDNASLERSVHDTFLKRLRSLMKYRYGVDKIRYYWCGEYGKERGRPHYHAILFGINSNYKQEVEQCWHKGYAKVCSLINSTKSKGKGFGAMRYVVKYTLKDTIHKGYGEERISPFSRKSQGLGKSALKRITNKLQLLQALANGINVNGAFYKLSRFLKDKALLEHLTDEEYIDYKAQTRLQMFFDYYEHFGSAPPIYDEYKAQNPYHIAKYNRHFARIVEESKGYAESLESNYRARELKEVC